MKLDARARLWAVLLCVLVAAGCASLVELSKLASRIQDNGYTGVSVNHSTSNGVGTLAVAARNTNQQTDDGETIFRLVWDTYPEEVDRVVVTVNDKTRSATANDLQKAYGPRKVQPAAGGGSDVGAVIAWSLLIAFLAGLTTTVIISHRRRRRRIERTMPPHPTDPTYKP